MTKCNNQESLFPRTSNRRVEVDFTGGNVSSDGGLLLLRQVDRKLGLLNAIARRLEDPRRQKSCRHSLPQILRQRVFGICLGYEDLNDHDHLRVDLGMQTAVGRSVALASGSTLCRWENRAAREAAVRVHEVLWEKFIASYSTPPKELILDFDATDDRVHGKQEGRFFHGYYDDYCFLPLYVFCGEQLLAAYLRESKIDGAHHAGAVLKLLVKRLRLAWPGVRIVFRGDSGFCRQLILRWCERNGVKYIVGLARNRRLEAMAEQWMKRAEARQKQSGIPQKYFREVRYAAGTWNRKRRVIVKAEVTDKGRNPRFLVTNLEGRPSDLYENLYCARGEAENRIKEQQLDLFADRTSAHDWWTNQFRLLLSSLGYTLMEAIRRLGLRGTELEKARCQTIRLRLLKIGAVIIRNTRRIQFHLASGYPYQDLFWTVARRLSLVPAPS